MCIRDRFTVLGILCLPVVPLVYASVFAMLLMRIFRRLKNKDFLTIVGTMFGLVIGFSISGLSGYMGGMEDSSAMQALLLEKGNSLAGIISGFFPNFRFLVRGLADESILQMALFLLTIAAVVAAFLWLAQKIYFSGVVGICLLYTSCWEGFWEEPFFFCFCRKASGRCSFRGCPSAAGSERPAEWLWTAYPAWSPI